MPSYGDALGGSAVDHRTSSGLLADAGPVLGRQPPILADGFSVESRWVYFAEQNA